MRFTFAVFLMLAIPVAFGFSCKVTCPQGYSGACVGDPKDGCNCSCEKESKNAKLHIIEQLKVAGASQEFLDKVIGLLANVEKFGEETLTDKKTGKQFTIMLKKQE
jgi:hypothetical protein